MLETVIKSFIIAVPLNLMQVPCILFFIYNTIYATWITGVVPAGAYCPLRISDQPRKSIQNSCCAVSHPSRLSEPVYLLLLLSLNGFVS